MSTDAFDGSRRASRGKQSTATLSTTMPTHITGTTSTITIMM
jgi:hypothetical protein